MSSGMTFAAPRPASGHTASTSPENARAGPSSESSAPGHSARRRRVPDALRQRIEISCDRCKKRKRRCIRHHEDETCAACAEAGADCTSTLPRKRRTVPSHSTQRYATMDAIIRKLYPDEEVDSMGGLAGLAERLGVDVGGLGDGQGDQSILSPANHPSSFENPELPPEGYLVPAPRGGYHYVGPASLVFFATCVRHLVARSNTLKRPTFDGGGFSRYLQAADFTKYKVSHTIEAKIQGHPATFAAGNEPSPSIPSPIDPRSRPSPGGEALRNARLPDRKTSDLLVTAFFDRVHYNFPLLHREAFNVIYETSFTGRNRDSEPGQSCLLYMVLVLGAQSLEGDLADSTVLQQHYLSLVIREGLGRLILTSSLENVQALLLLALYQHNAGERNTAWILIGQAVRAAVASGLHRDGENTHFDPFERNIRRMVWWSLHIIEQTVSLALGRPSFSDVINVNVSFPDPAFEAGISQPEQYLRYYVTLTHFMVKIKKLNAMLSVHYQEPKRLVERTHSVLAIHSEIISWKKNLPDTLSLGQRFESPLRRRLVLLLIIWADYLEAVLCRPYLLARVHQDLDQTPTSSEIDDISALSISAALASATKLLILADSNLLEGAVWLDYYCVQHAIMIISLHFLGRPDCEAWSDTRETISRLIAVAQSMRLAPTYRITMNVALQLSCIAGIGPEFGVKLGTAPASNTPERVGDPMSPSFAPARSDMGMMAQMDQINSAAPQFPIHAEPTMYSDLYNLGFDAVGSNPWDFFDIANFTGDVSQPPLEGYGNGFETETALNGMGGHPQYTYQ